MRKQNLPLQRIMTHDSLMAVAQNLNKGDIDGLYAAVGDSHISAQHVVENLVSTLGGEAGTEESLSESDAAFRVLQTKLRLSALVTLVWLWMVCRKAMFT